MVDLLAMRAWGVNWGHKLSYGSQLDSGANNPDANNPNGFRWFVEQMPELGRAASGDVQVIRIVNDGVWFTKSGSAYLARYFSLDTLTEDTGTKEFTYNDGSGRSWIFHSFDASVAAALRGKFKRFTDAHSITYSATYNGSHQLTSIAFGGTPSVSFNYTYYTSGANAGKLQYVTVQRGSTNLRRLSLTYYVNADVYGTDGDLRTQSLEQWSGSAWEEITTHYYRYYTQSGTGGFQHGLRHVLHGEGHRQAVLWGNSQVPPQSIDQISDGDLNRFADNRFEYDANNRVVEENVASPNRTSSSPNAKYGYAYSTSTYSAGTQPDRFNKWVRATTETLPDSITTRKVFTNYAGQIIFEEFIESGGVGRRWFTHNKYDSEGRLTEQVSSEAITGYTTNTNGDITVTISSSAGLIRVYTYYTTTNSGTGAVAGLLNFEGVKQGSAGSLIKTRELTYENFTQGSRRVCPIRAETLYQSEATGGSVPSTTTFSYVPFTGSLRFEQITTTLPVISAAENGSGTANTRIERFDQYGQLLWRREERGFLTRFRYGDASGGMTQRIDDVATASITDNPAVPPGPEWVTPAGGGLHLVTDYTIDNFGRSTQELGPTHNVSLASVNTPVRRATWNVFRDAAGEVRSAQGYITQTSSSVTALIEPITVRRTDDSRRATEIIVTRRATGVSGALTSTENVSDQTRWVRWTQWTYDNNSTTANRERVYFQIPTSGAGTSSNNYSETLWQYGVDGRRLRELTPSGTVRRWTYDVRKRVTGLWEGTDDTGATEADPSDGGANSMRQLEAYQYDNGGVGSHKLTEVRLFVDANAANDRITTFGYDWRNRPSSMTGDVNLREEYTRDNQGRITRVDQRNGTGGTLIGRSDVLYDLLGRVYRRTRFAVNVSSGSVGNGLSINRWYDASGNLMKVARSGTALLIKHRYDGVGRRTFTFRTVNAADNTYAEAASVTTDTVMEQEELLYDSAGNVTRVIFRQRFHDETAQGELASPSTSPKARVSYTAYYSDPIGRPIAKALYGTNGGASFSRPTTVPARSDTVLVTTTEYTWGVLNAGESFNRSEIISNVNPRNIATHLRWNSARWLVEVIRAPGGIARTTRLSYNPEGRRTERLEVNSATGNQSTKYIYGATLTDSQIASNRLLRSIIYPDSSDTNPSGTNQIKFEYNRQGQIIKRTDQAATVHVLEYDKRGRVIHDRVTALGTNVNGAVRRISRTFEPRGLPAKVTSVDNATVGSGAVVNEVELSYNDFGQVTSEWQEVTGAVTGTSLRVQYSYANGSANHVRPTSITYADGRVVSYAYGTSGGLNDQLCRTERLDQGATKLVEYSYLGLSEFVRAQYSSEPGVELTYIKQGAEPDGEAGDRYAGLDRFGRVIDQRWIKTSDGSARVRIQYGFDRNGNRLFRDDLVAGSGQDELYAYDNIDQLTQRARGTLNTARTALTGTAVGQENFTLDGTGNWRGASSGYVVRENGSVVLDQNRTTNQANEIQTITASVGANWLDPVYDAAGNMTSVPQPGALTSGYTARYDAWNRLVELLSGVTSLATYRYDGRSRRVSKVADGQTRRFYYSLSWQVLEERTGSGGTLDRQFVWGMRYMDDLVERDLGSQRLYVLHDFFNPVAVCDTAGVVLERYGYDAFGATRVMDSSFGTRASSSYQWETRFGAARWDSESGLLLCRFRLLHPMLGAWISRDRIQLLRDNSLYKYVANRPINTVDVFGLCEESPFPNDWQPYDLGDLWSSGNPEQGGLLGWIDGLGINFSDPKLSMDGGDIKMTFQMSTSFGSASSFALSGYLKGPANETLFDLANIKGCIAAERSGASNYALG